MVEPLTLSAVGAVVITEGIKFLYAQAGETLKRWRDRKDAAKDAGAQPEHVEPVQVVLPPDVFEGHLVAPQIHFDTVARVEEQLRGLRKELADYADGIETVNLGDRHLLEQVDALRQLLEAVYDQRLTFRGEARQPSGPMVAGKIDVDTLLGEVEVVRARRITGGTVTGEATVNRIEKEGRLSVIDADTIGR